MTGNTEVDTVLRRLTFKDKGGIMWQLNSYHDVERPLFFFK